MKSKRIAGVSVNINKLPTKEDLIKNALKTKDYIYKRNALELINKEIKESGLYRSNKRKSAKPNKNSRRLS